MEILYRIQKQDKEALSAYSTQLKAETLKVFFLKKKAFSPISHHLSIKPNIGPEISGSIDKYVPTK